MKPESLINTVICGDVFDVLPKMPDNFVDCVVTSPPYWSCRDYGVSGQIGLEEHPEEYVNKIVKVVRELKRVIKPTGTIWLNVGDCYGGNANSGSMLLSGKVHSSVSSIKRKVSKSSNWPKPKQRLLIPYRIAIRCEDELGLYVRNDIVWAKSVSNWKTKKSIGSALPCPYRDRLANCWEPVFLMTKSEKYYFNVDAVRIPFTTKPPRERYERPPDSKSRSSTITPRSKTSLITYNPNGKNPGDCVMFPTSRSSEPHPAQYPELLPDFAIRAGCPKGGIVLDPFVGSGTTIYVARYLGRRYIGIDISREFTEKVIRKKLSQKTLDECMTST